MSTASQVDGLAGALLRCVDEPDRIALVHDLLDRYCHRLRNRLNSMKLSLYLARKLSGNLDRVEWGQADAAYRSMELMIEQVQQFCNPLKALPTEGDLGLWIERSRPAWQRRLADRPIHLETDGPEEGLATRIDWAHLAQGIETLTAFWAAQGPQDETIRLNWGRGPDLVRLRFEAEASLIRSQGEAENLALPALARVLRAHRGSLAILAEGAVIELTWPAD